MIELEDISKRFGSRTVVDRATISIEAGDYVSVMGPSGCGKTSLLNILGLLERPTSGDYRFEGAEVSVLSESERAAVRNSKIGFIFQNYLLLNSLSVIENVLLPKKYLRSPAQGLEKRAESLLTQLGLANFQDRNPSTLSGGEKQRVATARAMLLSPRLILADEPTGNLDEDSTAGMLKVFRMLSEEGVTIVMVTHESAVAQESSRFLRISGGRLVEC